jgi:LacI family transcriptional regulator
MPKVTIKDVAEKAGLSISTVNRVLHEPSKVREETVKLTLRAAEEVGFYGIASIRDSIRGIRSKVRIGILLLQRTRPFYKNVSQALETAAAAVRDHEVMIRIDYLDEPVPQNVSAALLKLAEASDVLGVVAPEHPIVAATIGELNDQGIKTFALISQLTARCNVGYIGLDNWKVGRTSGWAFDNICKRPGKIGILVGSHRYRCQETNESGFRSYFREHSQGFELLEARSTFETASIAREVTEQLLEQHPDLAGLYVSGGGISGAIAALRDSGRASEIVTVGYELLDVTRAALMDGTINFLISHPLPAFAEEAVTAMIRTVDSSSEFQPPSISLPFEIHTSENL